MFKRKRDSYNYENSDKFQTIINSVSSSGLYMPEFYRFLYKRKNNISEKELDEHMKNVSIYNSYEDYKNDLEKTSVSIYYKKGHWYAVVNNIIFDAYRSEIQLSGTNSFCQSYAVYLAANNGVINNDFQKKAYIDNIKKMACLHCEFINNIHKDNYLEFEEDFNDTFNEMNEYEYTTLEPVSLDTLKLYLQEICNNNHLAHDFAVSKEDAL